MHSYRFGRGVEGCSSGSFMCQGRLPSTPERHPTGAVLMPPHSHSHTAPPPMCHHRWMGPHRVGQPLETSIGKLTAFLTGCFHLHHLRIQDPHKPEQNPPTSLGKHWGTPNEGSPEVMRGWGQLPHKPELSLSPCSGPCMMYFMLHNCSVENHLRELSK